MTQPTDGADARPYADLARELVTMMPAADQREADQLLEKEIFPNLLGDRSRPRVPGERAVHDLKETLLAVPPEERIPVLRKTAKQAEMGEQRATALSLAIARYGKEHAEAASQANEWGDPLMPRIARLSVQQISDEATRRLAQLKQWRKAVESEYPDVWDRGRVAYLQTELTLQSARTGHYETAAGGLVDFLREVGAEVDELDEF